MVLATFHIGPPLGLGPLLERLPGDVLSLTAGLPSRVGAVSVNTGGGDWGRVVGSGRALQTLRGGGCVIVAVDGYGSRKVQAPLLGRNVPLAAGAFSLSRMTGAPLLPVVARWQDDGIDVVTGGRIAADEEAKMAAALTRWLESYVLERPAELGPDFVSFLRRSPLLDLTV